MKKNKYSIIIIGAGIGGLVCGAYLSKRGEKVLIIEKNNSVGGLCTSFKRKNYIFDTGVHYLSSCRPEGYLGKLFRDLKISINLRKLDPSDTVISNKFKIDFGHSFENTKQQLKNSFELEKNNIDSFFSFVLNLNPNNECLMSKYILKFRNMSFSEILDNYFRNKILKDILGFLLCNIGLHPRQASALYSLLILREFIFDGGYYPMGGMYVFPEELAKAIKKNGGEIMLNQEVERININDSKVVDVVTKFGNFSADWFVGNNDVHSLFYSLSWCRNNKLKDGYMKKLNGLRESNSIFLVHIALKDRIKKDMNCIWYSKNLKLESIYNDIDQNKINTTYVFCFFPSIFDRSLAPPNGDSGYLAIVAPYCNKNFWNLKNRNFIAQKLLKLAEEVYPALIKKIDFYFTSTPVTFQKYTNNYKGAAYGWASCVGVEKNNYLPFQTSLENLLICSHWSFSGIGYGGIPMVTYNGMKVADFIINKLRSHINIHQII